MKRTFISIMLFVTFLIIYFLQCNFFSWFTIAGISPNLFVIFVMFISLFAGIRLGIMGGLITGFFLDLVIGKVFGPYTIMYFIISIMGIYFDKNFSKDSKLTVMLIIIASTMIFEIGVYILNIFILESNIEIFHFIRILIIEMIYNAILTIILYPVIKKVGYKIEEEYKTQKLLTRYF